MQYFIIIKWLIIKLSFNIIKILIVANGFNNDWFQFYQWCFGKINLFHSYYWKSD